ncbi:MAG: hydrogenase maturation nickel metallochaperone HypA [Acidobacteria bacterium]|nr:MAG: hydrogenase maturation nickel metallochaperone HypA [Acidobacteriota bacterium]PIE90723.1 MAG: hydrogenase maturation nickel metallochaperone HypA [Acidobacteriota bacterium]
MHELTLAMNMVEQLDDIMRREKASRLLKVTLEIGALSGVEREPMAFCFPMAARGTRLEGARLEIEEVPVTVQCESCGQESQPEFPAVYCAACGHTGVDILAGRDFKIKTIEVE